MQQSEHTLLNSEPGQKPLSFHKKVTIMSMLFVRTFRYETEASFLVLPPHQHHEIMKLDSSKDQHHVLPQAFLFWVIDH
jgi:hypothetical protein